LQEPRLEPSVQLWKHCCRRNKSVSGQTMHRPLSSAQTYKILLTINWSKL